MATISGKTWGGSCRDLRGLYIAYVRSVLEYASPVWASLISDEKLKFMEVLQNIGARIATGLRKSTDIESLLLEANLVPMRQRYKYLSAVILEKYRRFPDYDPMFDKTIGPLPKIKNTLVKPKLPWRCTAETILGSILERFNYDMDDIQQRESLLIYSTVSPW
jgi:hypothetical protein